MKKLFVTLLVLLGCGAVLSGCGGEMYSWNQKLTIEVQTPNGLVSSSSVMKVSFRDMDGWFSLPESAKMKIKVEGEAVVAKLNSQQYLFVLHVNHRELATTVFAPEIGWDNAPPSKGRLKWPDWIKHLANLRRARSVSPQDYPIMVTFGDITDPASVKKVNPVNLADTFGIGYSLKSVTLEITDETVTNGVVKSVLGWLEEYHNKQLDGDRLHRASAVNKIANSLNVLQFVRN